MSSAVLLSVYQKSPPENWQRCLCCLLPIHDAVSRQAGKPVPCWTMGGFSCGKCSLVGWLFFYGLSPVVPSVVVTSPLLRRGGMSTAEPSPASPRGVGNHGDMRVNSSECVADMIFLYKRRPGLKKNKTKEANQASSLLRNESGGSEGHGCAPLSSSPLDVKSPLRWEVFFPGRRGLVSHYLSFFFPKNKPNPRDRPSESKGDRLRS